MFNIFPSHVSQLCLTDSYSEPIKRSKKELFVKIVIGWVLNMPLFKS